MTFEDAAAKLKKYGQEQVLRYYDELDNDQKEELLNQIEETDMDVIELIKQRCDNTSRGNISPLSAMELKDIEKNHDRFRSIGLKEIEEGHIGAVLLAGGMGTRLGSDNPKGMYNIGITRELYIFECLINNIMDVVNESGSYIHLFIMTSEKNHNATCDFFNQKKYFGYPPEYIHFFRQEMAAATDFNGRIYLEEKGRMATSPNGNGGWFLSLKKAGLDSVIEYEGIEWLNVFAVDNVLQRIADPVFIGATLDSGCNAGAKVVRKNAPDEKVGVICNEDGRPSIVEYYELTDELMNSTNERGEPAYNFGVILNYLFNVKELNNLVKKNMPLHIVEKKIPYLNENCELIKPDQPNGFKFESLVLDMIRHMDSCLPFEVDRLREFAPIKNPTGIDSVERARELLKINGVQL